MRFIEHWGTVARRSATSWTAAALGFLLGALGHTYMAAFAVIGFLPAELQLPLAGLVGAIVIGGPIVLARITEQPRLAAKLEEKRDADQS